MCLLFAPACAFAYSFFFLSLLDFGHARAENGCAVFLSWKTDRWYETVKKASYVEPQWVVFLQYAFADWFTLYFQGYYYSKYFFHGARGVWKSEYNRRTLLHA